MEFAPIHLHSEYSQLDGISTCREIAERCHEIGVSSCGLTDHGTITGHLEFDKVMREYDLKSIYGIEAYHGIKTAPFDKNERDQAHFIAGAMTNEGLRNLWRLVDKASENFRYVGRVNWEMLSDHKEGLFATSACISGLVSKGVVEGNTDALNQYLEIFGDNFYIELHTYPTSDQEKINLQLIDLANERGIPFIVATDAHFAKPSQYELHDAYVAMQTGETILMPKEDRKMWHPKSLYIQGESEIRESLDYLPKQIIDESLSNSAELASKCNANLPTVKRHLPIFVPKESPWIKGEEERLSAAEILLQEVEKGLKERYGVPAMEVWDRAATELDVFLKGGLEHYFLQAWDFVQFCKEQSITIGPGRGSAAGSIIAYALGITDIDPLEYDLIFERFYNPGREKGFPDIDCDFPTKDREKVKQYMEHRWGKDKVRSIGTTTRLKPLAAIDKTHKVCGIGYTRTVELKKIIKEVPDIEILGPDSIGWDEEIDPDKTVYILDHVGDKIEEWVKGLPADEKDLVIKWLTIVRDICSRVSGYGIHPSGVVISDVTLADELPCMWNAKQKTQVTCFPMADVEKRQFVKDDWLGLATLDILNEWKEMVEPLVGEIDFKAAEKDHDPEMWTLLEKGLTLGVFQVEDGYARHLCKEFKPKSIKDLAVIGALNRPGPIRSGAPESFIRRRNGEEDVTYDHPILEPILKDTEGILLYQEHIIKFFSAIGYDLSDADAVRKILGKKKPEEMRDLLEGKGEWKGKGYREVAYPKLGQKAADIIWNKVEDFAKYSFNFSHAIAYATVGFRAIYAKWNSPAHFFIACIRVATYQGKSKEEGSGKYVGEARRMGIAVLPPNIDTSQADIAMVDGSIYFGFSNVKGIGKGAGEYLRYLRDKYELFTPEDIYDAIQIEQEDWEKEKESALNEGNVFKKKSPRQTFRQNQISPLHKVGIFSFKTDEDISMKELQTIEKDLLGVIITDDCDEILEEHREQIEEECDSYSIIDGEEGRVRLAGIISQVVPKRTRKDGKAMGLVTIEFEGEQAEFVVFSREWKAYKFLWNERTPGIFTLVKNDRGLRFEDATKLT